MSDELFVSDEMAAAEFDSWCAANEIDLDDVREEAKRLVPACREVVLRELKKGFVTIDGENISYKIHYKQSGNFCGTELKFSAPTVRFSLAMDKEDGSVAKSIAGASCLTGQDVGLFRKLALKDFGVCDAIVGLFAIA